MIAVLACLGLACSSSSEDDLSDASTTTARATTSSETVEQTATTEATTSTPSPTQQEETATSDAGPINPDLPWFAADSENVFVQGLSSEQIEASTGLTVGDVVVETGENLVGPTISFADGEVLVQLDATTFTFDDVVASNPQASLEKMGDYEVAVLGGLGAVIDFPEGPVTVSSFVFSEPNSGVDLARLIAETR